MPGAPPKSKSLELETTPTHSPSIALDKWAKTREDSMLALLDVVNPERVSAVMSSLYDRAVGMELTQQVKTKEGNIVTLTKSIPPNVNAAKLFLAYAIGTPESLGGNDGKSRAPTFTPEALAELMEIGKRHGASLKFVKPVEREVIDVEGKEIKEGG